MRSPCSTKAERAEAWRIGAEAIHAAAQCSNPKPMIVVEAAAYQMALILMRMVDIGASQRELLAIVELVTMRAYHVLLEIEAQAQTGQGAGHA
jgi:hypothetical protein